MSEAEQDRSDALLLTGVSEGGLRALVVEGGRWLLARQVLGVGTSLVGMVAIARIIGPELQGYYITAFGLMFFSQTASELNLDVFLVRHPGVVSSDIYDTVFTMLCLLALAATAILLLASRFIADVLNMDQIWPILIAMFSGIPLVHLQRVPLSKLERALEFGRIGSIEIAAQALMFGIAIALALVGWQAWSLVAGWWCQQIVLLFGYYVLARYRPHFRWHVLTVHDALAYGLVTTASTLLRDLRPLIIPVLVGSIHGAAAVAIVSLAVRILDQLSVIRQVISRMSIALIGRLFSEPEKLRMALTYGMELQIISVAAPTVVVSLSAHWIVPLLFGEQWQETAILVSLLTPASIALATFSLHGFLLMSLPRPWRFMVTQAVGTLVMWTAGIALIPNLGAVGYAYAELVAIIAWLVTALLVARHFGRPRYHPGVFWALASSIAALAPILSWWLVVALPVIFIAPVTWREFRNLLSFARGPRVDA